MFEEQRCQDLEWELEELDIKYSSENIQLALSVWFNCLPPVVALRLPDLRAQVLLADGWPQE